MNKWQREVCALAAQKLGARVLLFWPTASGHMAVKFGKGEQTALVVMSKTPGDLFRASKQVIRDIRRSLR